MNSIACSSLKGYPITILYSALKCDEGCIKLPENISDNAEWGFCEDVLLLEKEYSFPLFIKFAYYSYTERKAYFFYEQFTFINDDKDLIEGMFLIGVSPMGNICVWIRGRNMSVIAAHYKAKEVDTSKIPVDLSSILNRMCLNTIQIKKNVVTSFFRQFTYKYCCLFATCRNGCWEILNSESVRFDCIWQHLYDGTHDKLNDGRLLKYHQAGKPKKLALKWHIGKSEYTAYFWFEEEPIREVFDKFYGAHPDTKTDFIIRIDVENKKYELALYRYGLKEPQIISEDVYQLLVFKNKFEDYRSDNYNQERGAWIW